MSINKDNDRGKGAEQRILHLLTTGAKWMPHWYKGVRKANPEEDSMGYDLLVKTDLGPIRLQVKAGVIKTGNDRGRKGYYEKKGILVVDEVEGMDKEVLKTVLIKKISTRRDEILAKRKAAAPTPMRGSNV